MSDDTELFQGLLSHVVVSTVTKNARLADYEINFDRVEDDDESLSDDEYDY